MASVHVVYLGLDLRGKGEGVGVGRVIQQDRQVTPGALRSGGIGCSLLWQGHGISSLFLQSEEVQRGVRACM